MGSKYTFFFGSVLVLLVILSYIHTQICTEIKGGYLTRIEMRRISYYETYLAPCYGGRQCTKQYLQWSDRPITVSDYSYKTVQKCCNGYIQDDSSESESIKCRPICKVHCKNGFCDQPNVCSCHEGYNKKRLWYGIVCDPVCENGCMNGNCVSPNTCECKHGYSSINGSCQPVCSNSCTNGNCIAPETCECLPGFRMSNSDVCEPYCSTGCENGECVDSETCRCNPGWHKVNNTLNVEICMPVCNEMCQNGSCVPPDTCICKPGYVKTGRNSCNFHCSECFFGKCEGIEKCVCSVGWESNENGTDCVNLFDVEMTDSTEVLPTSRSTREFYLTTIKHISTPLYTASYDEINTFKPTISTPNLTDGYDDDNITFSSSRNYSTKNNSYTLSVDEQPNYTWIILGLFLIMFVISIIILIVFRNNILRYFKGTEYIVEDYPKDDVPKELLNVTFSSIKKEDEN